MGQRMALPPAAPTAVVALGSAAAAIASAGGWGHGRIVRGGMRALGSVMLLRAALGGRAALALLGMPRPRERFLHLDRRWYRPAAAVLGVSLWVSAGRR